MSIWDAGVKVEHVDTLYARRARLDVPGYYKKGERNPYSELCEIIPKTATYFTLLFADDSESVALGRAVIKGVAKRKRVREATRSKDVICLERFGHSSSVLILWV